MEANSIYENSEITDTAVVANEVKGMPLLLGSGARHIVPKCTTKEEVTMNNTSYKTNRGAQLHETV